MGVSKTWGVPTHLGSLLCIGPSKQNVGSLCLGGLWDSYLGVPKSRGTKHGLMGSLTQIPETIPGGILIFIYGSQVTQVPDVQVAIKGASL